MVCCGGVGTVFYADVAFPGVEGVTLGVFRSFARVVVMLLVREMRRRRVALAWRRVSVAHKARQLNFTGLSLVPNGDRGALDLMVLEVPCGNADPAL